MHVPFTWNTFILTDWLTDVFFIRLIFYLILKASGIICSSGYQSNFQLWVVPKLQHLKLYSETKGTFYQRTLYLLLARIILAALFPFAIFFYYYFYFFKSDLLLTLLRVEASRMGQSCFKKILNASVYTIELVIHLLSLCCDLDTVVTEHVTA